MAKILEEGTSLRRKLLLPVLEKILTIGGFLLLFVDLEDSSPPFEKIVSEQDRVPQEESVELLGF